MADAHKCDRCGDLNEGVPAHRTDGYDLCDDCTDDYFDFLDGKGLQQEPIGFSGAGGHKPTETSFSIKVKDANLLLNNPKGRNVEQLDDYMACPAARNY